MADAPATVLDAVNLLEAEGFGASFRLRGDGLECGACGNLHDVATAEVVRVYCLVMLDERFRQLPG